MKTSLRFGALMCAFVSSFILLPSAFPQGSLTPPGAPAPTMKTLDQIDSKLEKRTPISSLPFIISSPGSYYVTGNLTGTASQAGIVIDASHVVVDLNGFRLAGPGSGSATNGINVIFPSAVNITIRNGTVVGWLGDGVSGRGSFTKEVRVENLRALSNGGRGISLGDNATARNCEVRDNGTYGIIAGAASKIIECTVIGQTGTGIFVDSASVVMNCTATDNASYGIFANPHCLISGCTAEGNDSGIVVFSGSVVRDSSATQSTTTGISASSGVVLNNCTAYDNPGTGILTGTACTLTNCLAYSNGGQYGIFADQGSTISNCTARANTSTATTSCGIHAEPQCTIRGCTSTGNTNTNASLGPLTGVGIEALNGSTIQDCTATGNTGDGIHVPNDSLVAGNICDNNGSGTGDGAGIHATSSDNRIEGNNVTDNDRGIDVDSPGNVIIKNSASGNTTNNYDIVANNVYGAVVDRTAPASAPVTGNSGPASAGTTDPWANFAY